MNKCIFQLLRSNSVLFVNVSLFENLYGIDLVLPPLHTHVLYILLHFFIFYSLLILFLNYFCLLDEKLMADISLVLWVKCLKQNHFLIIIECKCLKFFLEARCTDGVHWVCQKGFWLYWFLSKLSCKLFQGFSLKLHCIFAISTSICTQEF